MEVSAIKVSVAEAVSKLPEDKPEVQAVNLRGIGGQPWYQIYTKTSAHRDTSAPWMAA